MTSYYQQIVSHQGWQDTTDEYWKCFQTRRLELSIELGCLMWGVRVVVQPSQRKKVLMQLHKYHPGISRMKNLTCSFVWWTMIDSVKSAKGITISLLMPLYS